MFDFGKTPVFLFWLLSIPIVWIPSAMGIADTGYTSSFIIVDGAFYQAGRFVGRSMEANANRDPIIIEIEQDD